MRLGRFGRALIGNAMQTELAREAVQLVDIVGEQVTLFTAVPLPDCFVDVDRHYRSVSLNSMRRFLR
jgi:hypothetical protein